MSHSSSQKPVQHGLTAAKAAFLAFCVLGIWVSYLTQGVVQESLSTKKFAPDNQRFDHLSFLNLAQNVVCFVVAFIMLRILGTEQTKQPPIWAYWGPSVTNTIGPACGLIALKYISYPAQMFIFSTTFHDSKSHALMSVFLNFAGGVVAVAAVMLAGALLYKVHYTFQEYICTVLVAGGVSLFALFKSSSKAASKLASPNAPLGYFLCFLNLALDGFTNATQDAITKKYPLTGTYHLMMGMNLWGAIYMAIYMFAWPYGGGMDAVHFIRAHPEAFWDIIVFCICGAVGQNFIFLTINAFGALINTTITTTRKFMSILISAIWTGSPLTGQQWAGVGMVFGGLSYQIVVKYQNAKRKARAAALKTDKAQNGGTTEEKEPLVNGGPATVRMEDKKHS